MSSSCKRTVFQILLMWASNKKREFNRQNLSHNLIWNLHHQENSESAKGIRKILTVIKLRKSMKTDWNLLHRQETFHIQHDNRNLIMNLKVNSSTLLLSRPDWKKRHRQTRTALPRRKEKMLLLYKLKSKKMLYKKKIVRL